jgi:hypothetical protein
VEILDSKKDRLTRCELATHGGGVNMFITRYFSCVEESRGVYRFLVGKPERERPLGRTRRRWEDNIKMDLQEVGCGVWTGLSWLRIGRFGGHL